MGDLDRLDHLEKLAIDDAEDTLVERPIGGIVDKVISAHMLKMGWAVADIHRAFGYDPFVPCHMTQKEEIRWVTDRIDQCAKSLSDGTSI